MPASGRRVRKKKALSRSGGEEQKYRRCEKSGCPAERPECFSNAIERFGGWYTVFALSSLPTQPLPLSYIFSTSTYNNPRIIFCTLCSCYLSIPEDPTLHLHIHLTLQSLWSSYPAYLNLYFSPFILYPFAISNPYLHTSSPTLSNFSCHHSHFSVHLSPRILNHHIMKKKVKIFVACGIYDLLLWQFTVVVEMVILRVGITYQMVNIFAMNVLTTIIVGVFIYF